MKKKISYLLGLLLICLLPVAYINAPEDFPDPAKSVVQINTPNGSGYGVAWGGENRIVTALHLVAGAGRIQILSEGASTPVEASIEKIYPNADLAMLIMNTSIPGLAQMRISTSPAPMNESLDYWQTENNSTFMVNETTALERPTTLGNLNSRVDEKFADKLCSIEGNNSPALNTRVFKFEEAKIEKKHSGSPLTFGGEIVGMIDGGVASGRPWVWAIPAREFNNLADHGVPPGFLNVCSSENLFSGLRSDNPLLSPAKRALAREIERSKINPISISDGSGNRQAFSLNFSATCEDIYYNMLDEDQSDLINLLPENYGLQNLFDERVNLYQEATTGAIIALPVDCEIRREGNTIIASSELGGAKMYITVKKTPESYDGKLDVINDEIAYLLSDRNDWKESMPDDIENDLDSEDPYYYRLMDREALDEEGNVEAEFSASLIINGRDFLSVTVQADSWEDINYDSKEKKMYYLMECCAILTDFGYY